MKIKSLLNCNVSFIVDGQRITLPANPTVIELDDAAYKAFTPRLNKLVDDRDAEWVVKPKLSKEEQAKLEAEKLKEAEALVAASKAKAADKK